MEETIKAMLSIAESEAKGLIVQETALGPAARAAFEILKGLVWRQWDPAVNELRLNLSEAVERHKADEAQFKAKVHRAVSTEEGQALVLELVQAAARATTKERMRMLAAAAIGVLTTDFDSEMRSRVARVIEQLEPSDVIALRGSVRVVDADTGLMQVPGIPENRISLLQTACLVATEGVGHRNQYEPTPVGRAVLKTLESWPRSHAATR